MFEESWSMKCNMTIVDVMYVIVLHCNTLKKSVISTKLDWNICNVPSFRLISVLVILC